MFHYAAGHNMPPKLVPTPEHYSFPPSVLSALQVLGTVLALSKQKGNDALYGPTGLPDWGRLV